MTLSELLHNYATVPDFYEVDILDVNQVNGYGDRPMHIAATRGIIEEMELLFSAGAKLNEPGEHGYTPLHCAVEQGHLDAAKWLLGNGADKELKNDDGITPKQLAAMLKEQEIERLLEQ